MKNPIKPVFALEPVRMMSLLRREARNDCDCPSGYFREGCKLMRHPLRPAISASIRGKSSLISPFGRTCVQRGLVMASWRDAARPIIARVIAANPGADPATLRKAMHDAYPFGERRYHPYKIWLDEIARQTGRKPSLGNQ